MDNAINKPKSPLDKYAHSAIRQKEVGHLKMFT